MHIAYLWLSYFPSQVGKVDLEKIAEQAAKEHTVHILVKNNGTQKNYEQYWSLHIHRFHSRSENSLIDEIWYSIRLPRYCFFSVKKISTFHIYNPFSCAAICHVFLRCLFPKSNIIFDIRTWPLKEWIKKTLNYLLINLAHLTSHHTIIISKQLLQHFFWVQQTKVHEIILWYTPPEEKYLTPAPEKQGKHFVYIWSIYPRRGIHHLLEAFTRYVTSYPDDTLTLVWWGDEAYYADLQKKYHDHQFIFVGKVPQHEVSKHLLEGDYGVAYIPQSSYFMDQPPLKTVEYLWHGLPVLATNTNGNKLFVQDTVNGILVDDDVESTVRWICLLRDTFPHSDKKRIAMSVQAYTRAQIYQQIRSLYI